MDVGRRRSLCHFGNRGRTHGDWPVGTKSPHTSQSVTSRLLRRPLGYNVSPTSIVERIASAQKEGAKIKRVGFLLKVKEDLLEEYTAHHETVWPGMLEALTRSGWRNYSIFARPDGLLFGYFEADTGFETSLESMDREEVNAGWQEFMAPYFEIPERARPDQMMVELDEIFHLD